MPVVVGGIIPPEDAKTLKAFGVAAVYTPKDFQLNDIMADIVEARGSARKSRVNGSTNAPFAFDFSQVTNCTRPRPECR